jgi:hypothetical protein
LNSCREFEEARIRIREAEKTEAEARRDAAGVFRRELDDQVDEKRHRNDKEKRVARDTQLMFQDRAKLAEKELRAAKEAQVHSRAEYRRLLEHQIA